MYVHFLKHEFFYIFLFSGLLLLFFSAFIKKTIVKLTALILFAVLFVMSMFEMFLYSEKNYNMLKFSEPDNFYNMKKRKEIKNDYLRQVIYLQKKNNVCIRKGNKNNEPYYIFRYTKCNYNSDNIYIFLGCSFTFGSGLNNDETLPYFFSKKTNFKNNVLNCGLNSRGSNTALNMLRNNSIDEFTDKKNVQHFFYSLIYDQIPRNFNFFNYGASDNWIFVNNKWKRAEQPFGAMKYFFAKSYIFDRIFAQMIIKHNRRFYESYLLDNLKEIDKIIQECYNSHLTIIVWPCAYYGKNFLDKLKNTGFDIIMLPEYLNDKKYQITRDTHPNSQANEEIAGILIEHLKKINKI